MPARPFLRCLVARPFDAGACSLPQIVPLRSAAVLHEHGWMVLVDPADEAALAQWEREQAPLNTPRWRVD